jgi:hypothetical protein
VRNLLHEVAVDHREEAAVLRVVVGHVEVALDPGIAAGVPVPRPNTFHRSRSDLPPTSTVLLTGNRAALEIVEALGPECVPR